jgi:hypothetical protein
MKNFTLKIFLISCFLISSFGYSKDKLFSENKFAFFIPNSAGAKYAAPTINDATVLAFFKKYSQLKDYQNDVSSLYKERAYKSIWYDGNDINEFGHLMYHKLNSTYEEGVQVRIPYKDKIDEVFDEDSTDKVSDSDTELLLSSMYILYLPKKKLSYQILLDSLVINPNLLDRNNHVLFSQYYKLQDVLKKYREIEKNNTWKTITLPNPYKDLRPDDTGVTIQDVRTRLFVIGDLAQDSKSNFYDRELMDGVMKYKLRHVLTPNYIITKEHIAQMNEPISDRIKTLMLNMERCRWIPPTLENQEEYVMVNIPSFRLYFVRNGNYDIVSNVFIGTPLTQTVIFSGQIDRIVFSPYWYVPSSIIKNELKLKMAEEKNYLADHNMEWNGGNVRQKPGPDNALGLVKFMFPNPNDIYMHDSPSKSLFGFEKRIFSHGCINVEKAKDLAISMMKDYPDWTLDKINSAMSGVKETPFKLTKKIPIYIGYFTAWVSKEGDIGFFPDVYERDVKLNSLLFPQDTGFKTANN